MEAHSQLGHGQGRLLDHPVIRRVAAARDKTNAQIVLRWHLQHGRIVFPKSVHRERMEETLQVFGFGLSSDEMVAIDGLDRGVSFSARFGVLPCEPWRAHRRLRRCLEPFEYRNSHAEIGGFPANGRLLGAAGGKGRLREACEMRTAVNLLLASVM